MSTFQAIRFRSLAKLEFPSCTRGRRDETGGVWLMRDLTFLAVVLEQLASRAFYREFDDSAPLTATGRRNEKATPPIADPTRLR
jgi:hypothetical protein